MKILLLCSLVVFALAVSAPGQESKPITATVGREFNVTLASNPTTGYKWDLAKPLDAKLLQLVTNIYERPETRLVGAGGREVWTFKAVDEGKTQIALKYVRPWETNVAPVRTTNFVVVISAAKPAR
jgi:inhibitor of cysteine peptidase